MKLQTNATVTNLIRKTLIIMFSVCSFTLSSQSENCDIGIVPDDLKGDKITINLSDLCSSCGPYGGNNGTISTPPNGATGCGLILIREELLTSCNTVGIDPQATEKTDYYFNPLLDTAACFQPDATTESQGETIDILKGSLVLNNGFYEILVCSQSTGNRSYEITFGCCPMAGTGSSIEVCETDNSTIDLNSLVTGETPGGIWTRTSGSGGSFDAIIGTFISGIGATSSVFQYAAPVVPGSPECNEVSTVTINITAGANSGINNTLSICSDGTNVNLHDFLGPNADEGGTWIGPSALSGNFLGTFDPANNESGLYTYVVIGLGPCPNDSSEVTVTIQNAVSAGSNGSIALCASQDAPVSLVSGLGGMPDEGGTWTPPTMVAGIFDPNIDSPGTYTYSVTAITPCGNSSATVEVTISTIPDAGENGSVSVCENDPTFNLIDYLNENPDGGGNWTPSLNSGTGVFDPGLDSPGNYTYSFNIENCETESAQVMVSVVSAPTGGIDSTVMVCNSDVPFNLYDYIGNPDQNGTWNGPSTLDNGYLGTFDPGDDIGGLYSYTLMGQDPCNDVITTISVENVQALYAGRDTTISACISDNAMNLFDLLGDDIDKGGSWSPELQSATNMFMPALDGSGSFTYSLAATQACSAKSATVTTIIYEGKQAGQSRTHEMNITDPPIDLFSLLGMNPDPGGAWNPAPLSGTGIFDPSIDVAGIYTYNVDSDGVCLADSANVVVSLLDMHGIPTLSTWGFIILLLLFLICGKIYLFNFELTPEIK